MRIQIQRKALFLFILLQYSGLYAVNSFMEFLRDYNPPEEKKIVIVITSYNNKDWYEYNLQSIFSQKYKNYRIIYLDDHSSDETALFVKSYVTTMNQWHRFTIVENQVWESQMANHYKAVYMCDDDEIVVQIDGDDWFYHDRVLELLNKIYSKWDVWLTYGQFVSWPQNEIGCSCEIPENYRNANAIREFGFHYSHPRTFYAWLFKKIKLKDLIYKGSFIPAAPTPDVLMMYPMIEMAGKHAQFIPDILYCWNRKNSLSQHNLPVKKEMPPAEKWEKYSPLSNAEAGPNKKSNSTVCNILICNNNQEKVNRLLSSCFEYRSCIGRCAVIGLEGPNSDYICYFNKEDTTKVNEYLASNNAPYLLIINDSNLENFELQLPMKTLETTGASLFFYGLDKSHLKLCNELIPYAPFRGAVMEYRCTPLTGGIIACQFDCEKYLWEDPALTSMVMMKMSNPINQLSSIIKSVLSETFKQYIHQIMRKEREIGLMYEYNKK